MTTNSQDLAVTEWNDFVGQDRLKTRLDVHIAAARAECRPLEHVLLTGPLGSGKSSMARLISKRLGSDRTPEPILELKMPMDMKYFVQRFDEFSGGILFLDEVHAMSNGDQEMLLTLLTEGSLIDSRGYQHPKSWLTVVAATTERDKVLKTLFNRFTITPEFQPYTDDELGQIVARMAHQVEVQITEDIAVALGKAAGGIPRNAEHLVLAARALQTTGHEVTTDSVLDLCVIDPDGLGELHVRYLNVIAAQQGRASQRTLALMLQVPDRAVPDLERLLLDKELIVYTPGGRELTGKGRLKQRGREVQEYVRR